MKVTYTFRRKIAEKIKRMPLKYFDTKTHGEVLSRVTNDVDTISNTLTQNLSQIVTSVTTIIGVLVMMLTISWLMTLVALLILPISFGLVTVVIKASQKYFKRQQDYLGHVNGHVEEMYGGHTVMKAFNGEEKSIRQFDKLNDELYGAAWKSQFLSGMMMPMMTFVGNLAYVGVSYPGRIPGGAGDYRGGRYPGLHPVCQVIHHADHPDGQHRQRAAVHHGRRRARLRVPR